MIAQNLDKLSDDAKLLITWMFRDFLVGWTACYMVEVRLDDPIRHLLDGGDGLVAHGGNGSPCYAKHRGEADWAIVHSASPEWTPPLLDDLEEHVCQVMDRFDKRVNQPDARSDSGGLAHRQGQ